MPLCISSKHFTETFHHYYGFGQKQPEFIHVQYVKAISLLFFTISELQEFLSCLIYKTALKLYTFLSLIQKIHQPFIFAESLE